MATLTTYLNFDGNCREAFDFYKSVFGGEFQFIGSFADMPAEYKVPDTHKDLVMHVALPIGDSVLMGSDTMEGFGPPHSAGNNFSVSYSAQSVEEADKIFAALSVGGQVTMPLADTFWGDYFGSFTDQFGVNWMVAFEHPREAQ